MIDLPDALIVLLTSSARVAIVSASWLDVFDDRVGQLLRASDHHVDDRQRFLGKAFGDPIEPRRHHVFEAAGDFGKFLADVVGLEVQARGELVACQRDRARSLVARGLQPHEQIFAAHAQLLDHVVADLAQRNRDVLAFLGQRLGDALRGLVDLLAHEIADRRKVLRQIDVDVVDGGTHLLGLPDESVALVGELLEQAADADLVVAVGAFERRDLVLHQRLELARARERALDAVAHGRDLAANRLSDGDDGIPRHALWLGEPHGNFRHRLRDQAQLLGAPSHMRHAEEEDDRQQRRSAQADHDGARRVAGAKRRVDVRQIGPGKGEAADYPGAGEQCGDEIGGARRPVLQRVQDLADRLLVVIGGAKGVGIAAASADLVGVEWRVGGRCRRCVAPAVGGSRRVDRGCFPAGSPAGPRRPGH